MKGTVTLCMPAFNCAGLISQTIDSVLAQTWQHWELRVVDDGCTDQTMDIVAAYAAHDPRIIISKRRGDPKGACTCRNEAVLASYADYVMFLDTDDIIEPFCLGQRVRAMNAKPELDFGIFPSLMFETVPGDLGLWWNVDKPETNELARQFRQDAIAQGTGVLFRRDSFIRIGMWDSSLLIWQDVDLFFRAYIQGYRYAKFFSLPPDLHNRTRQSSISRQNFFIREKQNSRAAVVKRAVELLYENGSPEKAPDARFMVGEIVSGAARSRYFSLADYFLTWAVTNSVISSIEKRQLSAVILASRLRMTRFSAVRAYIDRCLEQFSCETTLGCLPYNGPLSKNDQKKI
jgi:glycosyltransferase involved in cell wall biosynthesis